VKRITLEQLAAVVAHLPPNPRIVVSGNFATPLALLKVLDEQVPEYTLHMLNAQPGIPDRDGVTFETCFVGPAMRHSPRLRYIPSRLSLVPVLYRGPLRPDAVLVHASAPRYDTVSLGIEVNVMPAAIEAARELGAPVIVQANPQMPYTYGDGQLYDTEIDYLVEVDEPVTEAAPRDPSEVSQEIGDRVAAQVLDGSTLQLGIGGVPDAVLRRLSERRGLRIWSEMFSDGALTLEHQGALDQQIPLTASFLFGSRDLYDFVHLNHRVRMLRTETTNDPGRIARQRQMTSVNSALQVDLFDQANASRIKGRIYSGFGGSVDFIDGALHSRGGASYIALPSWHPKAGVSTIVPRLDEPVTSFQHSYVVTEQGVAPVVGLSERDQARSLIENAAHPDAREGLWEAAAAEGLA
jgi:acyl-CoA hydrolase